METVKCNRTGRSSGLYLQPGSHREGTSDSKQEPQLVNSRAANSGLRCFDPGLSLLTVAGRHVASYDACTSASRERRGSLMPSSSSSALTERKQSISDIFIQTSRRLFVLGAAMLTITV